MDELTQSSPILQPPPSNYFGYYKVPMTIYHCTPDTTREKLLHYIHTWLEAELGEPRKLFRKISFLRKVVRRLSPVRRSRFEDVTRSLDRWFQRNETQQATINIGGYGVVLAEKLTGGDERPCPLLAIIDGVKKEIVVPMSKYEKARPLERNVQDPEWQRLYSPEVQFVDWEKCLLSLQEAGLVWAGMTAVWGSEQRREAWAKNAPVGSDEHELRLLFLELHEELLGMVERFRSTLPVSSDGKVDESRATEEGASGDEAKGSVLQPGLPGVGGQM